MAGLLLVVFHSEGAERLKALPSPPASLLEHEAIQIRGCASSCSSSRRAAAGLAGLSLAAALLWRLLRWRLLLPLGPD